MQTKQATATTSKVTSTIDITEDLKGISEKDQESFANEIGELLVEEILNKLASVESPIAGGSYKTTLSKKYAEKKMNETGSSDANLDLAGDLIRSIDFRYNGNTIEIGVFDSEQAGKADGHNNFTGKSRLPRRQFLPEEGQNFTSDIVRLVNETAEKYRVENIELDEEDLEQIESKDDLFELLSSLTGLESKRKMSLLVLRSQRLSSLLDEYDLLDLMF